MPIVDLIRDWTDTQLRIMIIEFRNYLKLKFKLKYVLHVLIILLEEKIRRRHL